MTLSTWCGVVLLALTAAPRALGAPTPVAPAPAGQGNLLVLRNFAPEANKNGIQLTDHIQLNFQEPVDRSSFEGPGRFWAFGRWSGYVEGRLEFQNSDRSVLLIPDEDFSAGELVTVYVGNRVRSASGKPFRRDGFQFQFITQVVPSALDLVRTETFSIRSQPDQATKAYGGVATDLDNDGFLDISIVNEISADVRVFLNNGFAPGMMGPLMEPSNPVGDRASPSEPSDFDQDGNADIIVGNTNTSTISVLQGLGDGTFLPQQSLSVGGRPRGVAVLDADGDGFTDIANTNTLGGTINVHVNDGTGQFPNQWSMDTGTQGVWGMWSADMTSDGKLDLVIGAQTTEEIVIIADNGLFQEVARQSSGGRVWQIACGDLNGDRHVDVSVANGTSNNGAILFGNGGGRLSTPTIYGSEPWCTATDLGDLDGDGDLDWVLSGYLGNFSLFTNDGTGTFIFDRYLVPSQSSSCTLMMDVDNDRDLDLALIDEDADEVILFENVQSGSVPCADVAHFTGRCVNGTLDVVLVASSNAHEGKHVRFRVDGEEFDATVVGDMARLSFPGMPGTMHTVELLDPPACHGVLQVSCN